MPLASLVHDVDDDDDVHDDDDDDDHDVEDDDDVHDVDDDDVDGKYKIESCHKQFRVAKSVFKGVECKCNFWGVFLSKCGFGFCFGQLDQSAATLIGRGSSWVIPVGFPRNKYQISTHFSSRIFEE